MFAQTIALFDSHYRRLDAEDLSCFNRNLGGEVRKRLEQLSYIVERVRTLELATQIAQERSQAALRAHTQDLRKRNIPYESAPLPSDLNITGDEFKALEAAEFEMELLTESFYYFAGRVRTILKNPGTPIPGLKDFECVGVRDTRNKLLEHAEGHDSKVSIQSFGWGGRNGPVIKALRYNDQVEIFPDRGLYANAEEFRENLESLLQNAAPQP